MALYVALIIIWATHALDKRPFNITHIGIVTQIVTIAAQAYTVGITIIISFLVQAISCHNIIHTRT